MTNQYQNIREMTSQEINSLIFNGKKSTEYVSMPMWMAEQILEMGHVEQSLKDWAWLTFAETLE